MKEPGFAEKARWDAFVLEYVKDFNASRAYLACGEYKAATPKIAQTAASRLLKKPYIKSRIDEVIEENRSRFEASQDRVILEQLRIALSDMRAYMTWEEGQAVLTPSSQLTDDQAAAIAEIYQYVDRVGQVKTKVKLHSKTAALESLFRHLGLYADDKLTINIDADIVSARERMAKMLNLTGERLQHANGNLN